MNEEQYMIPGFKASTVAAGIKKDGKPDMALICSEIDAVTAGVFTTNQVKAAPVVLSQEVVKKGRARAIVVNSGNANACTGREGLENARSTAAMLAQELGVEPDEVLVASTGVIGAPLDMEKIKLALPRLAGGLSPCGVFKVAEAIMTTDSFPKVSRWEGTADGRTYQIIGLAKGAGMIMPDMATMLCFVLSDVRIDADRLRKALSPAVEKTFNRITVDGDMSTNDTVLVMANGKAANGPLSDEDYGRFQEGITFVLDDLATMIVRDGEGATKVVRLTVTGAASQEDALTAARNTANSSLVKTAFYGQDPNWGRIIAALGRSGIRMKEEAVSIWIEGVKIVEKGLGTGPAFEKEAAAKMTQKEFTVTIDLSQGDFSDHYTTCDLTHEYITINADYRT
ncbi:bifunctional glutamate N-acetyltransferase/amino-acid acetyltransferase ArgJ [Thermodesulfobacteriota bacterium]